MKRPGNILVAMLLSLMMIYWGTGVVVMHCCHTDQTAVVAEAVCCQTDCNMPRTHCMQLEVRKLPPSVVSEYVSAPQPQLMALPMGCLSVVPEADSWAGQTLAEKPVIRKDGFPPRSYLSLLTVLII